MKMQVAIYARVSSVQQADAGTIESQLAALRERVAADGMQLSGEQEFVDAGYSGATLARPALERLRDWAATGLVDQVYVHSPDRLARKYAYQILVVDELRQAGVEVVFLNRPLSESPEDDLLLQVQGMMAEYERAKILERVRRGKRHAAHRGSINVLTTAPYGYRRVAKHEGQGEARLEVLEDEARVVRQIFDWVGLERITLCEVSRRLQRAGERSPSGKSWWSVSSVWNILKNSTYMGTAVYGKTRVGPLRPRQRVRRGCPAPRCTYSTYDVPAEEWIRIPVPTIVSEDLFSVVQEQLRENRARARQRRRGANWLLQGLVICQQCGYAYCGTKAGKNTYYRCISTDVLRVSGQRACHNKYVRADLLEEAVWQRVRELLEEPERLEAEYRRRLETSQQVLAGKGAMGLQAQMRKIEAGIARMIDAYAEGLLEKSEFEPRIQHAKERIASLEMQHEVLENESSMRAHLQLVISRVGDFAKKVQDGLAKTDDATRREVIRALVKRVEVGDQQVTVVFRVMPSHRSGPGQSQSQDHLTCADR